MMMAALNSLTIESLPESAIQRLSNYLSPIDRLSLQLSSRTINALFSNWNNIVALEIRVIERAIDSPPKRSALRLMRQPSESVQVIYRISMTNTWGLTGVLKSSSEKSAAKTLQLLLLRLTSLNELTIQDTCLGNDYANVLSQLKTLSKIRLWNCSRYFHRKRPARRLLQTLFSLPQLTSIVIVDSNLPQTSTSNSSNYEFALPSFFADVITSDLVNLQISGIYISSKTLTALCEKLRTSLRRLAIGGTLGKESKKEQYRKALEKLKVIKDLDIPPYIFCLSELSDVDDRIVCLIRKLHLESLGFRHYNSTALFKFIEFKMPRHIRLLRIYHSAHRMPNFAQIGAHHAESDKKQDQRHKRQWNHQQRKQQCKNSWFSVRRGSLSSKNSVCSEHSLEYNAASNAEHKRSSAPSLSICTSTSSECSNRVTDGTAKYCKNQKTRDQSIDSCMPPQLKELTIVAIEETSRKIAENMTRIRHRIYSDVKIYYVQQREESLEILGQMSAPIRSSYVYTSSSKREVLVIKGDLVRPIPLIGLGMESDYELSDWDF